MDAKSERDFGSWYLVVLDCRRTFLFLGRALFSFDCVVTTIIGTRRPLSCFRFYALARPFARPLPPRRPFRNSIYAACPGTRHRSPQKSRASASGIPVLKSSPGADDATILCDRGGGPPSAAGCLGLRLPRPFVLLSAVSVRNDDVLQRGGRRCTALDSQRHFQHDLLRPQPGTLPVARAQRS